MDFEKLNGRSIEEAFAAYCSANPEVYRLFSKFVNQWISMQMQRGKASAKVKISSKQVIGRIRWFTTVETSGKDYKINDAFTALYARKFIEDNPVWSKVFELRELRRKGKQISMFK